jgi:CRISPR/Cas system endoribonuclease Cas6 (RAMP superfamily)
MTINELRKEIKNQEEKNINLFKIFQYRLHEKEMQPIIEEWREGSKKLRGLLEELYKLEKQERETSLNKTAERNKTFVNSFGEATTREITSTTYKREQKKTQKQIMSFMS